MGEYGILIIANLATAFKATLLVISAVHFISCSESEFSGTAGQNAAAQRPQSEDLNQDSTVLDSNKSDMETFYVVAEQRPVDIVLTVDDSGSMQWIQTQLAAQISTAFTHLQNVDYRLVLNTTDWRSNRSRLRHFMSSTDSGTFESKISELQSAIQSLGTSGSGDERGMLQAIRGTQERGGNWLREDSVLAFIIVSDEDNCSNGHCPCNQSASCDNNHEPALNWFLQELSSSNLSREVGNDARVYALVNPNPQPSCRQHGGRISASYQPHGRTYVELVQATRGQYGDICDGAEGGPGYGPILESISQDISNLARTRYRLANTPKPETLNVWVNSVAFHSDQYQLSGSYIEFNDGAVSRGDRVEVSYER